MQKSDIIRLRHIGMRNRLIHAYFDVNLEILWKTVTEDLPGLIDELEKILPSAKA